MATIIIIIIINIIILLPLTNSFYIISNLIIFLIIFNLNYYYNIQQQQCIIIIIIFFFFLSLLCSSSSLILDTQRMVDDHTIFEMELGSQTAHGYTGTTVTFAEHCAAYIRIESDAIQKNLHAELRDAAWAPEIIPGSF